MFIYCIINVINKSESWWIIDSPDWIKNNKQSEKEDSKKFEKNNLTST